ncbi:MAG TPA: P1 family peptidase, partial [Sphingobacteriaceae bacterium]
PVMPNKVLHNNFTSQLFMAAIEATEEAIINSLFTATTTKGLSGHTAEALPLDKVLPILKKYNRIKK